MPSFDVNTTPSAADLAAVGLTADLFSKAAAAFKEADADGSGEISGDELPKLFSAIGKSSGDIAAALKEMDEDGSGEISFEEFLAWFGKNH